MNLLALLLLVSGLASFAAFHFLPGFETSAGWHVWLDVGEMLRDLDFVDDPEESALLASFLMITLLIVASPFLTGVLRKSRLCWWLATIMSGLASIAFVVLLRLGTSDWQQLSPGGWFLLAAPVLNLAGLLSLRGVTPSAGDTPDTPEPFP